MEALDDAFLRFLASLSGHTVDLLPGIGGFGDALNSLAFQDLCARHDIACEPLPQGARTGDRLVVVGSVEVALRERARLAGRRTVVLPGSVFRFEQFEGGLSPTTTAFWRDRRSHRMAILQGLPHDRSVLCHPLAVHLDGTALAAEGGEAGSVLTLHVDGQPAAGAGDRVSVRLDGSDDRWASPDFCRSAVRSVAALMAAASEIRTDDPDLAILAARLGKAVRLGPGRGCSNRDMFDDTLAPLFPKVALDLDVPDTCALDGGVPQADETSGPLASGDEAARLRQLLTAARREAQHLAQERDRLFIAASELRNRHDADAVAAVRSHRGARERAELAERRVMDRLAEAEARAAQEREAAMSAAERLSAVERARASAEDQAAVARGEAAAREAALERRLAASEAALDTRTHQALALQSALDAEGERAFATEGRIARMRALIDARTAAGDEARRDAESVKRRFDALVSSSSWRMTRPFRGLGRGIKRLIGTAAEAPRG